MTNQQFSTTLIRDVETSGCVIALPFDPKEAFGKFHAPVRVEINEHRFASTTFQKGGAHFVAVNRTNREAAGIEVGDMISAEMDLDPDVKEVDIPEDLKQALRRRKAAHAAWVKLDYAQQKEHVDALNAAKRPELRKRRVHKVLKHLLA